MRSRVLLQIPELTLGEFACAPGDRMWDEVNDNIGARPHVVFPRTHVLIAQDGAQPVLATPNHVVFYSPHQLYRRGLRDARGDRSLWLAVAPELLERRRAPSAARPVPSDARTYLLAVALARHLARRARPTGCWPRRRRCGCSAGAFGGRDAARSGRGARARAREHAELAEAAKELLAARMAERLSLARARRRAARLAVPPRARVPRAHRLLAVGLRPRPAAARRGRPPRRRARHRPLPARRRARLLLAEPLQRPLPRGVRPPAVGACAARNCARSWKRPRAGAGVEPRRVIDAGGRRDGVAAAWMLATLGLALGAPAGAAARRRVRGARAGAAQLARASRTATSAGRCQRARGHRPRPRRPTSSSASRRTADGGTTWVYSGRTGTAIYRFDGAPGDFQGDAIADAGDTNGDGVHDIISGALGAPARRPGPRVPVLRPHRPAAAHVGGRAAERPARLRGRERGRPEPRRLRRRARRRARRRRRRRRTPAPRTCSPAARTSCCAGSTARTPATASAPAPTGRRASTATAGRPDRRRAVEGRPRGGGVHVFSRRAARAVLARPAAGRARVRPVLRRRRRARRRRPRSPDVYAADYAAAGRQRLRRRVLGPRRLGHPRVAGRARRRHRPGPRGRRRQPRRPHRPRRRLVHGERRRGRRRPRRRPLRAHRPRAAHDHVDDRGRATSASTRVGVGDVNRDRRPDLLLSAAEGDAVYLVAGR